MKIKLPKTLAEPLTIPWKDMDCGMDIEIQKLLNELLHDVEYTDVDIEELMHTLSKRIQEQSDIVGKRMLMKDLKS